MSERFKRLPPTFQMSQNITASDGKPYYDALADIPRKRRLPSSYTDRRRKLPSASGMNLTIMRQQQGVMMYDYVTQKPCLRGTDSPLYLNYRCNAYQVRHCSPNKAGQTVPKLCLKTSHLKVVVFKTCVILALI